MVKPICFGALQRRLQRRVAGLDIARDVLDHHDGVVHHEAGRDGERHQRQIVDAETEQVHHAERSDQRQRYRYARNGGRGDVAQKQKDHHHHQRDGEQQGEFNVADRRSDCRGAVREHRYLHRRRQRALQLRQQFLDAIHDLDHVGAGLPLDVDDHRGHLVHPRGLLDVLGIVDDVGHIGQVHGSAVAVRNDQRPVLAAAQKLIVGGDGEGTLRAVEGALGLIDVGRCDRAADVFEADPIGGESRRIGLHPHGWTLAAADADQAHARQLRDLLRQSGVREIFNAGQRQRLGGQRQRQHRRVRRIHLAVDGRIGQILGQVAEGRVDRRLHFLLGDVQVQGEGELQRDDRASAGAARGHLLQPRHLPELALERSRHRGGHDVRARARVERHDLNGRIVDLGQAPTPATGDTPPRRREAVRP